MSKISEIDRLTSKIADPLIQEGVESAITKTLLPAAAQKAYPGHYTVTADGSSFGAENTWPGLDSWEMAGAYLMLGKERLVLDYFDFVQASQRKDGNVPFAVFPAESPPGGLDSYLWGLNYPDDVHTYKPIRHDGQPEYSDMSERKWIGLYKHWQIIINPLSILAPICYVLTANEIIKKTQSDEWLKEKIESIELAGKYILSRKSSNGFISGAGFYIECPPRNQWDGITQCYGVEAFRNLAEMNKRLGNLESAKSWENEADILADNFRLFFWQRDHFAEYIHPQHGIVDFHGLTDVNWAAVALSVATDEQIRLIWPQMVAEKKLWHGDMPTQLASKPYAYRDWELEEPLPFERTNSPLYDVAAMGRVWYLEALACLKMGENERVYESVKKVCLMGKKHDWFWYERYHPLHVWDVYPAGPKGYCEYAAILARIVLGNPELFSNNV